MSAPRARRVTSPTHDADRLYALVAGSAKPVTVGMAVNRLTVDHESLWNILAQDDRFDVQVGNRRTTRILLAEDAA